MPILILKNSNIKMPGDIINCLKFPKNKILLESLENQTCLLNNVNFLLFLDGFSLNTNAFLSTI